MDYSINVYITNLSQFEYDGLIIGSWFTLPTSIDEIREKLLMKDDDTYEVEDWEAPFRLDCDSDLFALNRLAELVEENHHYECFPYLEEFIDIGLFNSLEEGLENLKYIQHFKELPSHIDVLDLVHELSDGTYFIV
ncbi:antirestriction protein ArdA [Enterococcus casseliflavus]|uniref:antirestriction protein ArdA n=1 Tax=Enterococcus casseliflavus TaxID=37734 RepID=UPI003D1070B0